MKPTASHLHAATAALLALLLSACASVAPTPPVARPAQPPSATAPTAAATPPAIAVRPPRIDRSYTSQNQDSRALYIVLHYTVLDWEKSLKVLTTGGQVSAHYLVRDDPATSYALVDENRRAWHAGASFWAGNTNLNSASIGIEIVNPGFVDTAAGRVYAPFPQAQVDEVIALVRDIQQRHQVRPERIIGHADIAPGRKQDPGPMFPWKQLADAGLIPWPDGPLVALRTLENEVAPHDVAWLQERLARIGYNLSRSGQLDTATKDVISTFQMKYRPSDISGQPDAETAALIDVAATPSAMHVTGSSDAQTRPYTSRW
ncbi:N-acetylmuramoyl-L-alanine amidase [Pelomonas aquatica]|jgi:N-acetylmuramoyl-L-alanine amidase|uniref:N-acetylmuramoyl-L-alanine amidase n=1 Tax=Pelomonas aquatica TaxID=431058 RepID=A0A9X4R6T7_9BURK|nr:N-acetylmuramoyl-L-alanine amidase [Pelomonas aquatica]MCY4755788.1 N-acetylmuramoyl-L-alanine amidase [Pelomonas aquatica]MDG0865185.1 N-acetylmuramoyl-L-alanine amidase [Pelomonas aquatica]